MLLVWSSWGQSRPWTRNPLSRLRAAFTLNGVFALENTFSSCDDVPFKIHVFVAIDCAFANSTQYTRTGVYECSPQHCFYIHMYIHTYWDVGTRDRDPRKPKKNCTTVRKCQKQEISWASDVSVCFSITGTRFQYYISLSTICLARRNGNLLVQIDPKNGFEIDKVKNGVWIQDVYPRPQRLHTGMYIFTHLIFVYVFIYTHICKHVYLPIYICICVDTNTRMFTLYMYI